MADHLEVYQGRDGDWYWRCIIAGNSHVIATGAEGFTRRWSAKRAARRVFPTTRIVVIK